MTDVRIYHTVNGADIKVVNGTAVMDDGLFTEVYQRLFGGNADDPGGSDRSRSWWGNFLESDVDRQLRSRTLYLLHTIAVTSSNLRRIQAAVEQDLKPLVDLGYIDELAVSVTVPRVNWLSIAIDLNIGRVEFLTEWRGIE